MFAWIPCGKRIGNVQNASVWANQWMRQFTLENYRLQKSDLLEEIRYRKENERSFGFDTYWHIGGIRKIFWQRYIKSEYSIAIKTATNKYYTKPNWLRRKEKAKEYLNWTQFVCKITLNMKEHTKWTLVRWNHINASNILLLNHLSTVYRRMQERSLVDMPI